MFTEKVALVCLGWYIFIVLVCTIGYIQLFDHYRQQPRKAFVLSRPENEIPHVTVIRPCKGTEPYLYECLAATFRQDYPASKLAIHLCISSRNDPAFPVLQKVLENHKGHDARIFFEEEDEDIRTDAPLGPNPKIRNMSRAYKEAKGDLLWIIDCNVWVNRGACGRMVDKLCGYASNNSRKRPYKLVHHLPISIDVSRSSRSSRERAGSYDETPTSSNLAPTQVINSNTHLVNISTDGGRLDEIFLASSHAKMYVAINTVAVAPCIVGKSNMFRISHLNSLTKTQGIDYFSYNICEDHLIGDLLWKRHIPNPENPALKFKNHGLVLGDLAIQPVSGMSVANYIARRVRWLRVRKFTVPVATLVEPGTESFLCSVYGAFGATTLPATSQYVGHGWMNMFGLWLLSIILWAAVDWTVHVLLHSGRTIELGSPSTSRSKVPAFVQPSSTTKSFPRPRRPFREWAVAWVGREALAFPIWTWAIWGGVTVTWREKRFWVGMDMKVHAIDDGDHVDMNKKQNAGSVPGFVARNGVVGGKKRVD